MGKGQKRKQSTERPIEPTLSLVPDVTPSGSRSASISNNDSVDRLAEIMTNIIQTSSRSANVGSAKGEVVPVFNPEDREQNSERWLRKVDELRQVFQWTEQATIYFALSKLSGLAEIWYKGLSTINYTWEEWKQNILLAFPATRDYYDILMEMIQRRKRAEESYPKYYYEKMALLNCCDIKGAKAVSCILGGIDDVVVKAAAKAGNYQTPEELFRYISTLHDLRPSTSRPIAKPAYKLDRKPGQFRKDDRGKRFDSFSVVKCHKCGKPGHIMKDCRQKQCSFCRKIGHIESDCFFKRNREGAGKKVA